MKTNLRLAYVLATLACAPASLAAQRACPDGYIWAVDMCVLAGMWDSGIQGNPYMGGALGYSTMSIRKLGYAAPREGWGVNVRAEVPILYWLMASKRRGFAIADLLYLEMDGLGKMTSDTLAYYGNGPVQGYEDKGASHFAFGYDLMAGWRFRRIAVFGGLRWQDFDAVLGASEMDGRSTSFVTRTVLPVRRRKLAVDAFSSMGGDRKLRGARVDLPFLGRSHLSVAFETLSGPAEAPFRAQDLLAPTPVRAEWQRMSIAVRALPGALLGVAH